MSSIQGLFSGRGCYAILRYLFGYPTAGESCPVCGTIARAGSAEGHVSYMHPGFQWQWWLRGKNDFDCGV